MQRIVRNLPNAEYHSGEEISHSGIVQLLKSPEHYLQAKTGDREPTPAMEFGSAFHTYVLEPALFHEVYSVVDEAVLAGTLATLDDYKAAATQLCVKFEALNKDELKAAIKVADVEFKFKFREDEFDRLYGDKIVLKQEQMESLAAMRASIFKHAGAAGMLVTGEAETSLFWTDEYTGLPCRIRPDWMFGGGVADLKSCITASKDAFAKTVANMGYDVQAAFYVDGMKAVTGRSVNFNFIAVEKTAPFSTACYTASQEMIEVGRAKYRCALELLKWCQDNQKFPGYQPSGEIETIDLPRWAATFDLEA